MPSLGNILDVEGSTLMTLFSRRAFILLAAFAGSLVMVPTIRQANAIDGQGINNYPAIIGQQTIYKTRYEDSLVDLARKNGLGYTEIVSANPGIDPWVPGTNRKIVLPTAHLVPNGPREGILINLADQRMYLFSPDGRTIESAPLGIGNEGWDTPTGSTTVIRKKKNPTWYVPKSVLDEQPELPGVIKPGPDNPLGAYAVYLGWPSYLFHGTNKPYGVGRRVSHGCVRLYPEDISRLFDSIKIGTRVTVIDQAMKIARIGNELWLEIHPNQKQSDEVEKTGKFKPSYPPEFEYHVTYAAGDLANQIDWEKARTVSRERRGTPVQILTK
ncbi:MAG: putative L,D-transpeptidase ErfK/SrfK [Alphaproteobacteria bacterium MarineAlpha11_Bin1]|nr:MAG: putative L,D-transpeptidase ErfK/SrfK [Alphaproteobacteria bacterium MarineAlpha11_Bin1]|tara:strand:+ start:131 stop:1114 length:984 start_codon:yes stop_codon:yes gene_type:complete